MMESPEAKPVINVTPLIDVLLVLLIIFMVAAPLRPHRFPVSLPSEPKDRPEPNPNTLIVTVSPDESLKLNMETGLGTVDDPARLISKLKEIFQARLANRDYAEGKESRTDISESEKIERTIFLKAPRTIKYGEIAKVVDILKGAGASPISFQIDGLD